jgi:hypothetical protein
MPFTSSSATSFASETPTVPAAVCSCDQAPLTESAAHVAVA